MNANWDITADQALHGYADGHRLLASSCRLENQAQQLLLEISDLSGSSDTPGFESYLTGYPLPEIGRFCLAKTWTAPEMPRPGCVWTHSILLDFSDLPKIGLEDIARLPFARPPGREFDADCYKERLQLNEHLGQRMNRTLDLTSTTADLLAQLTDSFVKWPDSSLLLPASSSQELEATILKFWCSLWPRLRRSTAFSTGSIRNRVSRSLWFDLQVVPINSVRRMVADHPKLKLVAGHGARNSTVSNSENYLIPQCGSDLESFESFSFRYGADCLAPRTAFGSLARIWNRLNQACEPGELVSEIAREFPHASDALLLKREIITGAVSIGGKCESSVMVLEGEIPIHLALLNDSKPFEKACFDFTAAIKANWEGYRRGYLEVAAEISRAGTTRFSEEFLRAVALVAPLEEILRMQEVLPELLPGLVARNPALAAHRACWEVSTETQARLAKALLDSIAEDSSFWSKIFGAVIQVPCDGVVPVLLPVMSGHMVDGYYEEWNSNRLSEISTSWKQVLSKLGSNELSVLKESFPESLPQFASICAVISPNVAKASQIEIQWWLRAYTHWCDRSVSLLQSDAMFVFFLVAASSDEDGAVELLVKAGRFVHKALATGCYSYDAWRAIEPRLPSLLFRDWDRCERLRVAVENYYYGHKRECRAFSGEEKGYRVRSWLRGYIAGG